MINPMNVYIRTLAETARTKCVDANILEKSTYELNVDILTRIVDFFGGKLKEYTADDDINKECPNISGNSFLRKENDDGSFLIGYCEFNTIDILHELGHAFLELDDMDVGDTRGCRDSNGGINELNAFKFARAFLMPLDLFQKVIIENSPEGFCDIEKIAKKFGTSYSNIVSHGRESYFWQ